MRGFARLSTVVPRMRATTLQQYDQAFFSGGAIPDLWLSTLSASGMQVTPELALTLSAFYCAVTTISYDLATLPPTTFQARDDGGKDLVRPQPGSLANGGIGDLAYKLRWQPNNWQTSTEFFLSMIAQVLMRGRAFAEISPGPQIWCDQLLPRHPDRVEVQKLPSGFLRYKLTGDPQGARFLTQDEMFVVRDLSLDGLNALPRVSYAAQSLGTILAAERASAKFFRSGMTAAMMATYSGDKDDEDEKALHASISRYAAGMDNTFGLLLVPDDIKVSNLAIDPDKAQMMLARQWGTAEVARLFRMPGYKLGVPQTTTYASQVQSAIDYVIGCLRPTAVLVEQAIQRDLILEKGAYFVEFLLDALMRGDPAARSAYYSLAVQNRWMWPSEVRIAEGMNPDPKLDALSEQDHQPGQAGGQVPKPIPAGPGPATGPSGRVLMHSFLAVHDNAVYCLRRERAAVEKFARKYANDPTGWQAALRDFYGEHAGFVSTKMRMPIAVARGYAAQHGSEFETKGVAIIAGEAGAAWEREEAQELAVLALDLVARAA